MSLIRTVVLLLALLAVAVSGFTPPAANRVAFKSTTAIQFKFLKELGFEKPSWLPDFGGKKKEEEAAANEEKEEEEKKEEVATNQE